MVKRKSRKKYDNIRRDQLTEEEIAEISKDPSDSYKDKNFKGALERVTPALARELRVLPLSISPRYETKRFLRVAVQAGKGLSSRLSGTKIFGDDVIVSIECSMSRDALIKSYEDVYQNGWNELSDKNVGNDEEVVAW